MTWDLYELIRGPVMTGTLILFTACLVYRVGQFFLATFRLPPKTKANGTRQTLQFGFRDYIQSVPQKFRKARTHYRNNVFSMTPFTICLTVVYHAVIMAAIFFTEGHNVLLDLSWGFSLPSIPEKTMDVLAIFVIVVSLYYLIRRAFSAKMRFPLIVRDYLAILATATPFITGFMAYHQWFDYRTVIICHMLSGQLMLIALLYTKLGHMIFFFFGRISLRGELNLLRGSRAWKTDYDLEKLPEPVRGNDVDVRYIRYMLNQKKTQMKMMLLYCARCSNCAKSCFLYANTKDASYIPSHKVFFSLGKLYQTKGKVQRRDLENMVDTIWNKCVLCERCYCFIGLNIPEMISLARSICRSQGVYKTYDN
jgi:ferredoxin